jgi:enoyl reductase-like protein/acyl dehydratase
MSIEERVAPSHDALNALLLGLSANDETQEVLASLWQQLPPRKRAEMDNPDLVAHALLGYLGDHAAWESPRLRDAREALKRFVPNTDSPRLPALLHDETQRFALTFAGQSATYLEELAALAASPAAPIITAVSQRLERRVQQLRDHERALIGHDFVLDSWITNQAARPAPRALRNAPVSYPLIFTTQIARYARLLYAGYRQPRLGTRVVAVAGHSQGVLGALCVAETFGSTDIAERAADYAELALLFGLRMQQAFPTVALPPQVLAEALKDGVGEPTPMAALHGLQSAELEAALVKLGAPLTLALDNAPLRKVVAGEPADLERLRRAIAEESANAKKARAAGRYAGRVPNVEWQYLDVSVPFHTPYLSSALERVQADAAALGFSVGALKVPVLDTDSGLVLDGDVLARALRGQCVAPVSWTRDVHTLVKMGATCLLDFGPSDLVARLSSSNLKGCSVPVLAIATEAGEKAAVDPVKLPASPGPHYDTFAPTLAMGADGRRVLENRFTRWHGRPPVFLAGMTPTTVETPIVAAAVNAGYLAELAGGGQVTEPILRQRLRELQATLVPGQGIVFNALYLDPYLWKLHFGPDRLVIKLRDEGFPICGVTVSAGIPPVDEAVALMRELGQHGIHCNSFKPGNDEQLKQVFAIADACAEITIGVQIEGGKAGGHHSWEDLDDLLWRHYAALRARSNIVLSVGGGIGTPAKANRYLRGTWHGGRSPVPMPVDAVFIGTAAMAAKEAQTSGAVKQALARAEGTRQWVLDGDSRGQVTSGRSGLDASIYYLDNAAAKTARLLDEVAGNAAEVARRKSEIVAALERTAKPYFGDLDAMSYRAVLERLLALTAIGTGTPYEDGVWPDVSYRRRFLAVLLAAEARLGGARGAPFHSLVQHERELDDPHAVLVRFVERYPNADDVLMHPHDVQLFLETCRRPGKPVSFVPVIDAEVRRWYKADSLWQAHAARYSAEQVLTIPGPEAVAGITRVDEPIADILGRFVEETTNELAQAGPPLRSLGHMADVLLHAGATHAADGELRADEISPERWLGALAELGQGALTAALVASSAVTTSAPARTVRNPLRDLLAHRPGLVLRWRRDPHGRLTALTAHTGRVFARLSLGDSGNGCTTLNATLISETQHTATPHEVALELGLKWSEAATPTGALVWDRERYLAGQADFYGRLLFGASLTPTPLFAAASERVTLDGDAILAYVAATGDDSAGLVDRSGAAHAPLGMAFVIAWKAIFRALCGASIDVLSLLHEENDTRGEGSLRAGLELEVNATVQMLEPLREGLRVVTRAELVSRGTCVATVTSRFLVRDHAAHAFAERGRFTTSLLVKDEGDIDFLCGRPWLTVAARPEVGDSLVLDCETCNQEQGASGAKFEVQGVLRRGHVVLGSVAVADGTHAADCRPEAIRQACRLLAAAPQVTAHPARELGSEQVTAPASMLLYARASGDFNPIHLDGEVARFTGLAAPIVHGMWTAAQALHRGTRLIGGGDARRVRRFQARFTAPIARGEALSISARQIGLQAGGPVMELHASVERGDDRVTVLTGLLESAAPRTAYVFPGQGIQAPGMGMAGYARSAAARALWDEAERLCRAELGFSLLRIVRDNPQELHVGSERFVHPKGVLYLTQFTQVAMLVMAVAQLRELRELGVYVPDALFCGHSVGEYSALAAVAQVVSLAGMIEVVYHRGLTMDRLIERAADGRSPYAMGVVRPHYAGLGEADVQALVAEVAAALGLPLEIVNYNIKGRQYSVTGDVRALERLAKELAERQAARRARETKPAYLEVPGIDVPFHSSLLRHGVDSFRKTLEHALPAHIDGDALVDRYIPNLIAKPFRLTPEFVAEVAQVSQSPRLKELLDQPIGPAALARTLLIELLAYQFASPVRWIETQEILLDAERGVERLIEIGVAEQPTLANMASATLSMQRGRLLSPRVLNSEAHFSELGGPLPPSSLK